MIIKRFSECQEELIILGNETVEKILKAVEGCSCESEVKKILDESKKEMKDKAEECQKIYSAYEDWRKEVNENGHSDKTDKAANSIMNDWVKNEYIPARKKGIFIDPDPELVEAAKRHNVRPIK